MEQKTFKGKLHFKEEGDGADGAGEFSAEFATLEVIDHDRDVTRPGAFERQAVVVESWNHGYDHLPVGRGEIFEQDGKAVVNGRFFLNTQAGREHYEVAKELQDFMEWSYTFDILAAEEGKFTDGDGTEHEVRFLDALDVWGVAPVERGAGIDTRTTMIKGRKKAIPSHSTPTSSGEWDGPANEARARSGEGAAYYGKIFAWRDPDGDPSVKASYKFVHHEVSGDGTPGAANVRGCQSAIGVLNGGRGGTTIPDADRQGVYDHLARHLRDAEIEPPELKAAARTVEDLQRLHDMLTDLPKWAWEAVDLQGIHDMLVQLGAKCAGHDCEGGEDLSQDEAGGAGKSRGDDVLAARVALELLEEGYTQN